MTIFYLSSANNNKHKKGPTYSYYNNHQQPKGDLLLNFFYAIFCLFLGTEFNSSDELN